MGYDAQNIYFGVRCYDTEPNRIVASSKSPDAGLASDDTITVFLDTFHDRRNGFFFSMNPIGAKTDALIRNEGENGQRGLGRPVGRRGVPRRPGLDGRDRHPVPDAALRQRHRRAELGLQRPPVHGAHAGVVWKPIRGGQGGLAPYSVSDYGDLTGLNNLGSSGGRYQFVPYAIGSTGRQFHATTNNEDTDLGGDLKINLTSQLVADVTVHTDFAEVEADQQQFNLERFKLFYPEQRQFFLEGSTSSTSATARSSSRFPSSSTSSSAARSAWRRTAGWWCR